MVKNPPVLNLSEIMDLNSLSLIFSRKEPEFTFNLGTMKKTANIEASLDPEISFARLELGEESVDMVLDPATAVAG